MQDDFIHPAQACTCLGLGLVRGVQPDTGTLFVLSHLPPHAISRVNCLIGGTSVLPESILLQQHAVGDPLSFLKFILWFCYRNN